MPLFSAERAWAQAMELKKEAEAQGAGGAPDPRKRHHLIGRLTKVCVSVHDDTGRGENLVLGQHRETRFTWGVVGIDMIFVNPYQIFWTHKVV